MHMGLRAGKRFLAGAMSESRGEAKENEGICGNATHGRTKHRSDTIFLKKKKGKKEEDGEWEGE
jgi:hypothetical protein